MFFFFFFSSRRRHTRFDCDWSSDVCSSDLLNGKNNSFGFGVRYPNDLWDLSIDWKQIEEHFRPTLGFVPRTDVRKLNISAEFDPRPKEFFDVRQMFHEVHF